MKKTLLFTMLLFCVSISIAQRPQWGGNRGKGPSIKGVISGELIDTATNAPIEFATIVLLDAQQKEVDGIISDEDGKFKIFDVKMGTYSLSISFLGYQTKTVKGIELTPENPDADVETVYLSAEGINLEEIEVTGQAAAIENKIDKIVYNADKDISTAGGDATDLLRRVPLLSVDLEGNVSLRGSSNVQILVNGKPSSIFAGNIAEALQAIPADQIKKVEVITTPTAKYDGEGTAGIINIITKKKSVEGYTGGLNASFGTRQNNANFNLSLSRGRFGMNVSGGSWFSWPRNGTFSFLRVDSTGDELQRLEQLGTTSSQTYGPNASIGAFYDINAYNSISTSLTFRGFGNSRDGDTEIENTALNQIFTRSNDSRSFRSGFDWTTDYRKTYKKPEQEWTFAVQVSGAISNQSDEIQQSGNLESLLRDISNENEGLNLETTVQTDYVHPITDAIKLETGIKGIFRNIDSDYTFFDNLTNMIDPARSDVFKYVQNVYAGYASFNLKLSENWGAVAGLRYERTDISGSFDENPTNFANDYDNFLPSVILSRKFKGFQTLKLSYSRRIQRPSLFYINPFINFSDTQNITYGSPDLEPELTDQIELGYNTFIKGIVLNGSIFYRRTTDIIESFTTLNSDTQVSETFYLNIGKNDSYGFNFFGSATFWKIWVIRGGINVFTYDTESTTAGINLQNSAVLWNGNVSSNLSLPDNWKVEVFGFFRSPRQTIQGTRASFSLLSMGIQKEFSKAFSLGIRIVEPFQLNKSFPSEIEGDGFYQRSNFSIPFQSFGISLNYRFGKLDFKQQNRRSNIKNNDTKDGGNSNF